MKVLLLSDTNSEHTEKWALGLANHGIKIGLFSFNKASYEWYHHDNITVFFEPEKEINAESTLTKLSYLKYVSILKKIIRHFKPDVLHAHYATSYGLIGALSGFKPFVLSVWGSDVYDFPTRSKFHRRIFQYNLRKASLIMSTSHIMRQEVARYTGRDVMVTPFGVDISVFSRKENPDKEPGFVYVGTIKPIEEKYGIIDIINAAAILKAESKVKYQFLLVGAGDLEHYRGVINEKGLEDMVQATGRIPFSEISAYHNLLDVFLNVSIDDSESFGVAAVEAMACERPVIISDVGGLMEVARNGEFALVVPKKNPEALAAAINRLVADPENARILGKKAREHVLAHYNWENNISQVIAAYEKLLSEPDTSNNK